jgi:hypothetical protein
VRSGTLIGTFAGEQLSAEGVPVSLPSPYSSAVLSVDPLG